MPSVKSSQSIPGQTRGYDDYRYRYDDLILCPYTSIGKEQNRNEKVRETVWDTKPGNLTCERSFDLFTVDGRFDALTLPFQGGFPIDDGTFEYIADSEFEISEFIDFEDWETQEFIESYWYGILDGEKKEEAEKYISSHFGGKMPIGNIYIDRWGTDGEFYQGGCFLYFEGETLRDYCYRNGKPYPVREIPDEVIEAFESGDYEALKKFRKEVPELKKLK